MDHLKKPQTRRSLKRKLEQDLEEGKADRCKVPVVESRLTHQDLLHEVRLYVGLLNSTLSFSKADRAAAKRATHFLSELAKNEDIVNLIVECDAVPALVKHLQTPPPLREGDAMPLEHEVEKGSAFALGLLAVKPEHQQLIVDAGALPYLLNLLKRHRDGCNSRAVNGVIRKAADAITNLAHENADIKTLIRIEGGIPPLVELLEHHDVKVQRAAAGALRTLAFKNDENKNQIVECNALPTLILMLCSEDVSIHYEAVGVIGNLVHSSPGIKKQVLLAGALQPVIGLLSSSCLESQREAALLIGQFAAADSDCKVHIVQRGAIPPLIEMLQSSDVQLQEMSAFALGRLAQDTHNQAGIVQNGGLVPLLRLLDSKNGPLQHNSAFALYGLADNEDNVVDLIRTGGAQKLQEGEFIVQPTKDCVAKTLKRLEEKIHGRVLNHLLYLMRLADKAVQRRVALALAHLCVPDDRQYIFVDNNGLELLLGLLESTSFKQQQDGSAALYKLATKGNPLSSADAAPPSPTPQVYLGEQYVNNPTLSDITFLVEGKRFYAHRICLLASSDTFRAMFDGGYRERDAKDVEIPNIRWHVFELMMRYIYTGSVNVEIDIAQDLLRAADQYLLDGLKHLCEYAISQDISVENVTLMYELAEAFNAMTLREACILFILEQFERLSTKPWYVIPSLPFYNKRTNCVLLSKNLSGYKLFPLSWFESCRYSRLIQRMVPDIRNYFIKALAKPVQIDATQL
ncbi:ARM repeat protein interacting with ABF2 isoform 4 [Theobroma cacao]|uniref:ARM repeat protein interacting with ABF2 isoform 4 n=1 Tax=Theobroma cacao TaxID=3641 RepID=A0A061DRR5_THECC|nr:ARM repeat protein interacting with ABF2 isoform 4 [Theobroma cacao]